MSSLGRLFGPRIETRFVATISLVVGIALVSLVVVVAAEVRELFRGELTTRVHLAMVAMQHTYPAAPFRPSAVPEGIQYVAALGPAGEVRVVAAGYSGPVLLPPEEDTSESFLVEHPDEDLLLFRRAVARPEGELVLWVAVSPGGLERRTWLVTGKVAIVGAAILISCYFLGIFLARTMLEPMSAFQAAMERVGEGSTEHVLLPDAPENFGQFEKSFNLMVDQIRRNREMERALLARDKMATVGQLAAAVAHETRNPLAAISSLTQLLADEVEEDPRLREYTRVVLKEVERLDASIGQLLEYARPFRTEFAPGRLAPLVEDVLTLYGYEARRRGVVLARAAPLPEDEPERLLDGNQIKQLLVNLVSNALSHAPLGSRVELGLRLGDDEAARLWVQDEGAGVDEAMREKVFDPYFSRRQGGTGLGLAIARRIVEAHCGRIWVEPGEGGVGARFVMELPRLAEVPELPEDDAPEGPSPWPTRKDPSAP